MTSFLDPLLRKSAGDCALVNHRTGVVLADHVKNLDWQARRIVFDAKAPADTITDVRERLRVLLGL